MRTFFSCVKAFLKSHAIKIPIIIFVIVALLLIFVGGITVYKIAVDPIKLFQTPAPTDTPEPTPEYSSQADIPNLTPTPAASQAVQTDTDTPSQLSQKTGILNILLVGADYAPEREDWDKNYYSDVMMVLAINFDEGTVDMISVPRDTFAPIYNTPGIYKLNSSLHHGGGVEGEGFLYVAKSIENVLGGVNIDYYIGVNMTGIKKLVDAIGGVDYYVDVTFDMNGRHMEEGYQHLDGQQVLDYSRARKGIDNDIGRVGRQKQVMIAIFEKLQQTQLIFDVPDIINAMKDEVYTNLSFEQLCALAIFGKNLDIDNISTHTLVGHFLQIFNWSMYILDDDLRIELIEDVYGFTAEPMQEASQQYARLTWAVIKAEGYIQIVQETIDADTSKKISSINRTWLKKDIKILQNAILEGDRFVIEEKTAALKERADLVFEEAAIVVNWFVNENPGKERMTG